ncbi:MAG: energy-coupling factor transporter ATPase [Acholeplasmatales bacterium]|jgi:energy-coupling factor transport system ATP-binding protein|nr:energy-coupling factor transporter ATPase [Acholeplasmatales bacterium]
MYIEVKNLYYKYNNTYVLKNINFSIEKGSWISIIGHNGSGKSTLAKLLVGLLDIKKGECYINDIQICDKNIQEIRKQIGIVFQNPDNQFVGSTVMHDIAFTLENSNTPREEMLKQIDLISKELGISHLLSKEPHNLSGGEKQKVAIASSLVAKQDIIIFDEATSMLDPRGVLEISDLIKKLNKESKKTIITITHDLEFAKACDKVIVLNNGEIVAFDTPQAVFSSVDLLKNNNLEMPYSLALYNKVKENNSQNEKLLGALWEYFLKM